MEGSFYRVMLCLVDPAIDADRVTGSGSTYIPLSSQPIRDSFWVLPVYQVSASHYYLAANSYNRALGGNPIWEEGVGT